MEMTTENSDTLPIIVQLSLTFGRRPDARIRRLTIAGHNTAISGL
jgi:hypothetical protein